MIKSEQRIGDMIATLVVSLGPDFQNLTSQEQEVLADDVFGLARDEDLFSGEAVDLLMTRIGGKRNLKSYVDTLMAGARRRGVVSGKQPRHPSRAEQSVTTGAQVRQFNEGYAQSVKRQQGSRRMEQGFEAGDPGARSQIEENTFVIQEMNKWLNDHDFHLDKPLPGGGFAWIHRYVPSIFVNLTPTPDGVRVETEDDRVTIDGKLNKYEDVLKFISKVMKFEKDRLMDLARKISP